MSFIIGLLTVVMVLDCVLLILLVLIQLPKKEAGAGLAFGGAATDALFGAGSGNVLTKATKYAAVDFLRARRGDLAVLQSKSYYRQRRQAFQPQASNREASKPRCRLSRRDPRPLQPALLRRLIPVAIRPAADRPTRLRPDNRR